MQFILDHIVAILIVVVIFGIIQTIQFLQMETGVEEIASYEGKQNSLDLAAFFEKDFNQTLHRYETSVAPFTWPTNVDGRTTQFYFYRDSLKSAPASVVPVETRYDLTFADSIYTKEGKVAVFQLERYECTFDSSGVPPWPPCAWHNTAVSAALITDFDIVPLRADKTPAANVAESYYLNISFSMIPPFRTSRQVVDTIHWNTLMQIQPY